MGLSIVALGALLGRVAGFRYGPALLIGLAAVCAVCIALGLARKKFSIRWSAFAGLEFLALAVLLGCGFIRRAIWRCRPGWIRSTTFFSCGCFSQGGGLPATLAPWIPGPFYYHFGFHAAAAFFAAVSGLSPDRAVLLFGQILGAAAALSAYRLSLALRRDRRQALLALALVGFFSQMPAYYLTWGRYTLLAGMVLLPLAMAEAVEFALRSPRPRLRGALGNFHRRHAPHPLSDRNSAGGFSFAHRPVRPAAPEASRALPGLGRCGCGGNGGGAALADSDAALQRRSVGVDVVASAGAVDAMYFANYTEYLWKLLGPLRSYLLLGSGLLAGLAALFRRGPMRVFAVWGLAAGGWRRSPGELRIAPFRPDHLAIVAVSARIRSGGGRVH